MAEEDKDSQREVLIAGKVDKDGEKGKEESKDKADEPGGRDQPAPAYGQYPPPPGAYPPPPPREPMFTSANLAKTLGIGFLIVIILLFVGSLLSVSATFVDEYPAEVRAVGVLIAAIGLFLGGIFVALPLMQIRDLSKYQKATLIILLSALIIGFGLLI
jgi:hypothetical protein